MKLKDIEIGRSYEVKVPYHVDSTAWHVRHYDRRAVYGEVVEVGVHYDVPRYTTYNLVGRPRVITSWHESARADGVTVRNGKSLWTVPCRNVLWPKPQWLIDREREEANVSDQ